MRVSRQTIVLLLVTLFGSPAVVSAQEAGETSRAELARRIEQTVERLDSVRQQRRQLKKQHEQKVQQLDQRIAALERQAQRLDGEVGEAARRVEKLQASIERARQKKKKLRAAIGRAAGAASEAAARMRQRVEGGIPLKRADRADRLTGIERRTQSSSAKPRAAAVADLFSFLGDELQRAGRRKQWNAPVRLDGGEVRKHAWQAQLGLATQMFVTEDGETMGVAAKRPDRRWRTDVPSETRSRIRRALQIMRQKRAPRLVPVPVPRGGDGGGKAEAEEKGAGS